METHSRTPIGVLGAPLPRKVAVFRALQLGDLLCSLPACRALRVALPEAEITLIGLPWARFLVDRLPYFDHFIAFPGYAGLPEQRVIPGHVSKFLHKVRSESFDLVIQMQGNGSVTNSLISRFGAKQTAGYYEAEASCPDPGTYIPYPSHLPEVHRHLALMEFLGMPSLGDELEFPVRDHERVQVRALLAQYGVRPKRYVCLHPGARAESRRWQPEQFAEVGDALANQGMAVVLTGVAEELPLVQAVAKAMRSRSISLAGRTTLGMLGALIEDAALLVANDTGTSHVATALQVPSVIISGDPEYERWRPLDTVRHRLIPMTQAATAVPVLQEIQQLIRNRFIPTSL